MKMKILVVSFVVLGLAFARGDPIKPKANQLEAKKAHQVNKETPLEAAGTQHEEVKMAHMQYKSSQMGNTQNQDLKLSQQPTLHSPQFQNPSQFGQFSSENQAGQFHNQNLPQQFHDQAQQYGQSQQFYNQDQSQDFQSQSQMQHFQNQPQMQQFQDQSQQFRNQGQQFGSSIHQEGGLLQSQQQVTPSTAAMMQPQPDERTHDFSAQQQFYSGEQQPQQGMYDDRSFMDTQDQQQGDKRFPESSGQQNQFFSGMGPTEMKSGVIPQVYQQRSAFDSRTQPIVIPGVTHSRSSSVVVSGLKNLPMLPALVYTAGAVPTAHAIPYSRIPWHKGGPYIQQHWQTPYARYVYSHIL